MIWEKEGRDTEHVHLLVHFPNACTGQDVAKPKPATGDSGRISPVSGNHPSPGAIICWLPPCTLAGGWNQDQSWELNPWIWQGRKTSYPLCQTLASLFFKDSYDHIDPSQIIQVTLSPGPLIQSYLDIFLITTSQIQLVKHITPSIMLTVSSWFLFPWSWDMNSTDKMGIL